MAVPTTMADLNAAAASNSPAGTDAIGATADDFLRALSAILRRTQTKGANVASAATVDIGAVTDGEYIHITGTTTITSFGSTGNSGISRVLVFDGALTLTHSANLILPQATNITTSADDVVTMRYEGSGVWRLVSRTPASAATFTGASVNRGGTNQTGVVTSTWTKVQFNTELFDDGSKYDATTNYRWTPGTTGKARVSARVSWSTFGAANAMAIAIYKNGSVLHSTLATAADTDISQGPVISALVDVGADTDYFEIFCWHDVGTDRTIRGNTSETWATFEMVA